MLRMWECCRAVFHNISWNSVLKPMEHTCNTQAGNPLYNNVQLDLVWTFVILTHHQLSATRPGGKRAHFGEGTYSFRSKFYYWKLPDYAPYVSTVHISAVHLPSPNGLTSPRHHCQSDEWVSNSVWSSHQRQTALNGRPERKEGRGKHFTRIRDEEGNNWKRTWIY